MSYGRRAAIDKVVREGFFEKVKFEQRPEWRGPAKWLSGLLQVEETAHAKALRQVCA